MLRLNVKLHYRFAGGGMTSSVCACVSMCARARVCVCVREHFSFILTMKLVIKQAAPPSCHFFPLWSKYPQYSVVRHP